MPTPYWDESVPLRSFPRLQRDLRTDVVVIGGGLTGITAAYLLKRAGMRVVLLERNRLGSVDTGATTAHLTCVTDSRLKDLIRSFGEDHARAAWDAGFAAIAQIADCVDFERIDCNFAWVPGYLHAPVNQPVTEEVTADLQEEAQAAADLGFDATYVSHAPFLNQPAVAYPGQARFHPRRYLRALIEAITGDGCEVFEHSAADDVQTDPLAVAVGDHRITCDWVVVATHNPIIGKAGVVRATLLQTKLALYNSYAVSGRTEPRRVPDALFWDTGDPYRYLRIDRQPDYDVVIFGGEDHKTGQADDIPERFERLETSLQVLIPGVAITHRWSGQVIETNDGLPFIGELSPRQFTITGCAGNGMTLGTLGAMMARDAILGQPNPWRELFDIGRTKIRRGLWDYLRENKDYPYYLIRDRFAGPEGRSIRVVPRGSGRLLELEGKKVAAYRHSNGEVSLHSAACTHMGCFVSWNDAEGTWDCPCHGSRFMPSGEVLAGPAERGLEPIDPVSLTDAASDSRPASRHRDG